MPKHIPTRPLTMSSSKESRSSGVKCEHRKLGPNAQWATVSYGSIRAGPYRRIKNSYTSSCGCRPTPPPPISVGQNIW